MTRSREARISKILKTGAGVRMTADGPVTLEMEKYFPAGWTRTTPTT